MLSGRSALVVETEFIIALGVQTVLESLGAAPVVLAGSAAEARAAIADWNQAALAIIEVETHRPEHLELARLISQSGIPVLGLSTDPRLAAGLPDLPGTPVLIKPVPDDALVQVIRNRLGQNPLPDVT